MERENQGAYSLVRRSIPRKQRKPGGLNLFKTAVLLFLAAAGILIAAMLAGTVWFWSTRPDGRILPGVTAGKLPIGGLQPAEAAKQLDRLWNQREIILTDGQSTWKTNPAFLGLWMDPGATLQEAAITGDPSISMQALQARFNPPVYHLEPVIRFDRDLASSQLNHWAGIVNQPAQDAVLQIVDGKPVASPSRAGRALDVDGLLATVAADPKGVLENGELTVSFKVVSPGIKDVAQAEDKANQYLALQLGGEIYDPITDERISWKIPQEEIAGWVTVSQVSGGYDVTFDRQKLEGYLAELPKHVNLGTSRAIDPLPAPDELADAVLAGKAPLLSVRYLPTEYTVQSSTTLFQVGWVEGIPYWRMLKANPSVNPNALRPGQKLVVPSKSDLLPLPVIPGKRIVVSIAHQRMQVFQDGKQIQEFVISTGMASSQTQPGIFQVQTHEPNAYASNWNLWMPDWLGIYEAWPDFMNGIHGLPMLSSGVRLWANVLGKPASYGCIILNLENSAWLYNWAENGVVVEIQR